MERFWARVVSVGAITQPVPAGDSPRGAQTDGEGSPIASPRESPGRRHPSRLSPAGPTSELGEELRPYRDHPDEQRQRRQSRGFFHENLQHARLHKPEHMTNIVPFMFSPSRRKIGPNQLG